MMRRLLAFVVIVVFLTGFAQTVMMHGWLETPASDPLPLPLPLPLAVGIHYTPAFRDHQSTHMETAQDRLTFPLGAASASLFEEVMAGLFTGARPVPARPPAGAGRAKLAAVIEPRIVGFTWSVERLPSSSWMPVVVYMSVDASIEYAFTLYSMDGNAIGSWRVRGGGTRLAPEGRVAMSRLRTEVADMALRNAARRFMAEFRRQPEIKDWLDRRLGPEKAR